MLWLVYMYIMSVWCTCMLSETTSTGRCIVPLPAPPWSSACIVLWSKTGTRWRALWSYTNITQFTTCAEVFDCIRHHSSLECTVWPTQVQSLPVIWHLAIYIYIYGPPSSPYCWSHNITAGHSHLTFGHGPPSTAGLAATSHRIIVLWLYIAILVCPCMDRCSAV